MTGRARVFIVGGAARAPHSLRHRLGQLGFDVCGTAARGDAAIEQIDALKPDVVLMELRLEGPLDGIETARRCQHLPDVAVVFVASDTDGAALLRAAEVRPFGYLVEPFEEVELEATIVTALERMRLRRAVLEANATLEATVAERTAQYRDTNARLVASESRYRTLASAMSDLVFVFDAEHRIVDAHYPSERILLLPREQFIGRRVAEVMPPHVSEAYHASVERSQRTGQRVRFEYDLEMRGEVRRFLASVEPPDGDGQRVLGIVDITEQHRVKEALRQSEESLSITLQSIGDAVLATDAARRVTQMNPVAERITGWPLAEARGRLVEEVLVVVHADTGEAITLPVGDVLETGEVRALAGNIVLQTRDGRAVPVADSAAPLRAADGTVTGAVLVFRDVTEERAVERERGQRLDLLAALNDITLDLLVHRNHEELLQAIVQRSAALFDAQHVDFLLIDGDVLVSRARVGPASDLRNERISRADGPTVWRAVTSAEPLVLDDYAAQPARRAAFEAHHFHATAFLPVRHGTQAIGVLALARTVPGRVFTPSEIAAGRLFAQLIALVLHQADIYQDAVRRADRKTAELRASEELFEAMANVVPTGLFRTDVAGCCEYVNPQFCRIAGLTVAEAMGTGWLQVIHAADRHQLLDTMLRAITDRRSFHVQGRFVRRDGAVGWFEADAVPWHDEHGVLRGFVGSVYDVTQRLRSESMLHALTVEAAGLGVDAYLRLVVQRLAETLGVAIAYVARHDGQRARTAQTLAVWVDGAIAANREYQVPGTPCEQAVRAGDAKVVTVGAQEKFPQVELFRALGVESYAGIPLRDHVGEVWGLLVVMDRTPFAHGAEGIADLLRFVASRLSAELERQRVEERFNRLFEYAPDATLMADEKGCVVLVNRRAEELFGFERGELVGQPVELLIPAAQRDAHVAERARYQGMARPMAKSARRPGLLARRKDGSVFPADINLSPMDGEHGPLVVASVRDITRQAQAEDALRHRDAILAAVTFAANRLLSAAQWRGEMPGILARIGARARASRAYLLERREGVDHGFVLEPPFEWRAVSGADSGTPAEASPVVLSDDDVAEVLPALLAGEAVVVTPDRVSGQARASMRAQRVAATALLPVRSGGRFWGALALDRSADNADWSASELDALGAAASAIGSAVEREQADAALRASEERLRRVVDHIGEGLIVDDVDGNVTFYNDRFAEIFGFDRDARHPIRLEDYVAPESRALLRARHNNRMRGLPVPTQFEYQGRRATGELLWIDVHVVAIRDASGAIVGTQSSIRDITARKKAELQISEALATLDATADAAYILDPRTLRLVYVNQGAVRTLGYSRAELLSMTAMDIEMAPSEAALRTLIAPLLSAGAATRVLETRHRRKDGSTVPVEVTLQYVRLPQGSERLIALARDISERLLRQTNERRAQRLEAIGTLAGGIAHDLNNALTPILMGLELLREQQPGRSTTVDQVAVGVERATGMVRQLLGFAKGAEGERTLIHPVRLIDEMHRLIASTFPKNIELHVRCDEDAPTVSGDATQLHQVLLNLCVNARDAMPAGGVLMLEASGLELDAIQARALPGAAPGKYLRLVVRDTGCGIPDVLLDRIFDPFFTTKDAEGGSGLGLSTALGIIKGHGGFIHVESSPGRHTTFEVYLPSKESAAVAGVTVAPASTFRGRGEMILFVDDERLVREMATVVLERLNFVPLTAVDGADALETLAAHGSQVYAVVTDLHMPRLDGVGFVRQLRQTHPTLPVAVASGRLDDKQAAELEALGVTTRLDKPFTQSRLADAIKKLLNR